MSIPIDAAIAALGEANPVPDMEAFRRSMAEAGVFIEERKANGDGHTTDTTDRGEEQPWALPGAHLTELKSKVLAPILAADPRRLILGIAAGAIFIAGTVLLWAMDNTTVAAPSTSATSTPATASGVPVVDYVIDLDTGEMTPLPAAILTSLDPDKPFDPPAHGRYAASSDGSLLAYVGNGSDGSSEVFVAGIDGTGVRQVTNHPTDVIAPAWSPDGAMIAYLGSEGLFVLDVATGEATQVPGVPAGAGGPQFTPDGNSLLYTFPSNTNHQLLIVPIHGGNSTVLMGREQGMAAGFGSLSPDGSLVTMLGNEIDGPGALLFLATTDGSELLPLGPADYCASYPAGTWSPDGRRIVCSGVTRAVTVIEFDPREIKLVASEFVAEGTGAIWLDDHTLLIDA
jgi:Tol biopolymer transport system component